jgi:hypothetical protein
MVSTVLSAMRRRQNISPQRARSMVHGIASGLTACALSGRFRPDGSSADSMAQARGSCLSRLYEKRFREIYESLTL